MGTAALMQQQYATWEEDFETFAGDCLQIRTKSGALQPLILNRAQRYIHERLEAQRRATGQVRAIILKGRQQGCSTYIEARFYWRTIYRSGVRTFILAHEIASTNAIYEMAKRYNEHCPIRPSTGRSNAKELIFDRLDSGYRIGTAGNDSVGRGSTLHYFHGSEVAFWPERSTAELTSGIIQAVPYGEDSEIVYESTANGVGNFFHQQSMQAVRGEGDYQLIFVPWYWQDEYSRPASVDFMPTDEEAELVAQHGLTAGQLTWRRAKIIELTTALVDGRKKFLQEYPNTIHEAFQVSGEQGMIVPSLVIKARQAKAPRGRALVVGVDPSRGGDRFAIMRRAGRCMYGPETHVGDITLGRAVQICLKILREEKPDAMFIDAGGGADLVDRLHELGYEHIVRAINFGGASLWPEQYKNKRAEMWAEMALWLGTENLDVQIPDSDELHADLCAPMASRDSADRLVLESKDHMRNVRRLPSPDLGDAAALTFAENVLARGADSGSFEPDDEEYDY